MSWERYLSVSSVSTAFIFDDVVLVYEYLLTLEVSFSILSIS